MERELNIGRGRAGVILGIPVGQPGFVRRFGEEQKLLFDRIPVVPDVQSAWLILLVCASTRANFWLRGVQPESSESYAEAHDARVWECLRQILKVPVEAGGRRSQRRCRSPKEGWTRQRCQCQGRGPLGELGRLFEDGPPTPSHFGRDDD